MDVAVDKTDNGTVSGVLDDGLTAETDRLLSANNMLYLNSVSSITQSHQSMRVHAENYLIFLVRVLLYREH
jgi:hypothetical protein